MGYWYVFILALLLDLLDWFAGLCLLVVVCQMVCTWSGFEMEGSTAFLSSPPHLNEEDQTPPRLSSRYPLSHSRGRQQSDQ